jgi:hypothetical protein
MKRKDPPSGGARPRAHRKRSEEEQQAKVATGDPPPAPAPSAPLAAAADQETLIRNLVSWARDEHGASFPKLEFDFAGGNPRRLLVTAPVAAREPLICLPRTLLLHGELAYQDEEYGPAFEELRKRCAAGGDDDGESATAAADDPDDSARDSALARSPAAGPLDSRAALVLLVAIERCRGQASRWFPYIAALPTEYDDPAWWAPEERARLRGTRLGAAADRYDRGLECTAARLRLLERLLLRRRKARGQQGRPCQRRGGQQQEEEEQGGGGGGALSRGAAGPCGWGPVLSSSSTDGAYKAARWARSVVWSRAFGIARFGAHAAGAAKEEAKEEEEEQQQEEAEAPPPPPPRLQPRPAVCLLPVLDMADHHPDAQVAWHLGPDGRAPALEFVSELALMQASSAPPLPAIKKEEVEEEQQAGRGGASLPPHAAAASAVELYNNYGRRKPTEELVLAYGFDLGAAYARQNDAFLVSVALRPAPAGDEAAAAGATAAGAAAAAERPQSTDEWEEAAGLQLRMLAASGLPLDLPLPPPTTTTTTPTTLPPLLCDLLLATAGAPDYALPHAGVGGLFGWAPRLAAKNLRFRDSPPAWRLAALAALDAQLRAKRRPLEWARREEGEEEQEEAAKKEVAAAGAAGWAAWRRRAQMARSYALGQLARLNEALEMALPQARAAVAKEALDWEAQAEGGGGAPRPPLPPPLAPAELARAGLRAEWCPCGGTRFVREPWSLAGMKKQGEGGQPQQQQQQQPVAVGLLLPPTPHVDLGRSRLLHLPLNACVAVPLPAAAREEEDSRARADAEACLIRAIAGKLERGAYEGGSSSGSSDAAAAGDDPAAAWLWASARADAADGLCSAATLVAAAAKAARAAARPLTSVSPAEAKSAASCRAAMTVAGSGDDEFSQRHGRLTARGLDLCGAPRGHYDEDDGEWCAPPPQTPAQALTTACFAHASLLVTRGGVLVATDEEETKEDAAKRGKPRPQPPPPRSWLVLAPVLCRVAGPVLKALPLEACVGQQTLTDEPFLHVSFLHTALGFDAAPRGQLFGARGGAAAAGRLAGEVIAEVGLAAALNGAGPAPVAGAVPWSRQARDDDDDNDDRFRGEAGARAIRLRARVRRVLAAAAVGAGELLLPPEPASSNAAARAEALLLADLLTGMVEDRTGSEHRLAEKMLLRSREAEDVLTAQAAYALARGGGGNGGEGDDDHAAASAVGAASGLPRPVSDSDSAARQAEARLSLALRAFADMCWRQLPAARVKRAASELAGVLRDAAGAARLQQREVDEEWAVEVGAGGSGQRAAPALARIVNESWLGATEETCRAWAKEVERWPKHQKKGKKKKEGDRHGGAGAKKEEEEQDD